jgi:hypothetical protein
VIVDLRELSRAHMPALPDAGALGESALATWRGRMINEYMSSAVFEGLAHQVKRAGLGEEMEAECREFAAEERRHGVLCGAVVEALGGEAKFEAPARDEFPTHEDADDAREALLRNVLSISCMSETIAVSLIGAERLEMPDGELNELLTTIYADEVGHARFGWRLAGKLVGGLSEDAVARTNEYLALAFAHLEEHELAHINPHSAPPAEGAVFGLCNGQDARELFYDTVTRAIVPSLQAIGLDAENAWASRHDAAA